MMSRLVLLLALSSLGVPSPLEDLEKEMQKEGIDLDKVHEELKRESKEVEEEFSDKATQDQLSKLRAAYPSTPNGTIQEMTELEINGDMANDLFEGDIVLSPKQWARALDRDPNATLQRRQALSDVVDLWQPMGAPVIPYKFKKGFPEDKKSIITEALTFWKSRTCVKFRSARKDDENVLEFNHNSTGCSSSVGMRGGKQSVNLAPGCFSVTIVAHEVSHAFGTLHVQSRSDRDAYVIVDTANIVEGKEHNFMKDPPYYGKIDNYGIPYEFGSMQHYHEKAFAINRDKPTIYAKPAFAKYQGSMESPRATFYDTLLINKMYKCTDKCKTRIACYNNGVQDGANCKRCFCPKGWAGTHCRRRPDNAQMTKLTADQSIKLEVPAGAGFQEKLVIIEVNNYIPRAAQVILQAPVGKRIEAIVSRIGDYYWSMCRSIGMEIVPTKDTRIPGFRFCGNPDSNPIVSDSNQMLVYLYNDKDVPFWAEIDFSLV
ncbi:hypothetical protein PFISCL1PPCAC_14056 [Pristionchus fissidentatus]|uniref:Zinc metalloproteinase n=1 Tax=Pristionchus fissidentatus TaxID=1538716 RepID=A0AAV5VT65_9BILA|nr:hypothetical protein PFISCL1PPCAC_14056 [Pristionchus fissidentatus]